MSDLISRQAVLSLLDSYVNGSIYFGYENVENFKVKINMLPSVTPQEPKWDRLYSWLNDMRFGIAPDETVTDIDERNVRTAQVDVLDDIMEWMEKQVQGRK